MKKFILLLCLISPQVYAQATANLRVGARLMPTCDITGVDNIVLANNTPVKNSINMKCSRDTPVRITYTVDNALSPQEHYLTPDNPNNRDKLKAKMSYVYKKSNGQSVPFAIGDTIEFSNDEGDTIEVLSSIENQFVTPDTYRSNVTLSLQY